MEFHGPRTQILTHQTVTDGTAVVYTVPVGKIFWLIESMLKTDAGATGAADVKIRDESDVIKRHINWMDVKENNKGIIPGCHFCPCWPVEMSAGEDIAVTSDSASLEAECDVFGFEVNA